MTILSQKIKENRERFENSDDGCRPYKCSDENCNDCNRDNERWEKTKSHLSSSTIDILDTIERWCEMKKEVLIIEATKDTSPLQITLDADTMHAHNSALTSVQDFIKQTKKEIK